MKREISQKIFELSKGVFPGGVNSPVRSFQGLKTSPIVVSSGYKDSILDADGHEFIDYCMSWGALILGHAPSHVMKGVKKQLKKGTTFGAATDEELRLAEKVVQYVPSVEKMRFVSSGGEAVAGALRLARGFTNRDIIVKFEGNYHGAIDPLLVKAGSFLRGQTPEASSLGIPKDVLLSTITLPYNDIEVLKHFFSEPRQNVAAVIIEPIAGNMGVLPASLDFLKLLRQFTLDHGILLIFDEVISGFRVGLKGAQGLYGILPDLTTFGKIIGGGFPAAAFGGRREIMDCLAPLGGVYQAGTLSGNPVAMRAGLLSLEKLALPSFYDILREKTNLITLPVQEKIKKEGLKMCLHQVGSMFTIFFGSDKIETSHDLEKVDTRLFGQFFEYLFQRGIYIPPSQYESWFVSSAHTKRHLEKTAEIILQFLDEIK